MYNYTISMTPSAYTMIYKKYLGVTISSMSMAMLSIASVIYPDFFTIIYNKPWSYFCQTHQDVAENFAPAFARQGGECGPSALGLAGRSQWCWRRRRRSRALASRWLLDVLGQLGKCWGPWFFELKLW